MVKGGAYQARREKKKINQLVRKPFIFFFFPPLVRDRVMRKQKRRWAEVWEAGKEGSVTFAVDSWLAVASSLVSAA